MTSILSFIASYWWLWLIITFCSFGLFFTNINLTKETKEILAKSRDIRDGRTFREAVKNGLRDAKARGLALSAEPSSLITVLAHFAPKIFGPLFFFSLVLKYAGY